MPIINLPVERIERQIGLGDFEGYVDDRHVSAQAVGAFRDVIQRGNLKHAPFYQHGAWRFAECQAVRINLARGLPEDIASALDKQKCCRRCRGYECQPMDEHSPECAGAWGNRLPR